MDNVRYRFQRKQGNAVAENNQLLMKSSYNLSSLSESTYLFLSRMDRELMYFHCCCPSIDGDLCSAAIFLLLLSKMKVRLAGVGVSLKIW